MKFFQVIFAADGSIRSKNAHPDASFSNATTMKQLLGELGIEEKELKIGVEYEGSIGSEQFECVSFKVGDYFHLIGRNISEALNLQDEIVSQNRIADLNMVRLLKTLDELNKAKTELEKVARYRENFISNISHEMRTPLTAIVGFSEILSDMVVDADSLEYLDLIKRSSDDLLVIINDLLDISQINTGKISLTNKEFNTEMLLNRAISNVSHSIKGKPLRLELNASPSLPANLIGDKVRLLQVLTNLLNNAIKYSDEGTIVLSAKPLEETSKSCTVQFSVRDTGQGIDEEQLQHIFQEFYQVKTSSARPLDRGIGLGLAITQRLVSLMDGKIEAKSAVGKGSEFIVTLPFNYRQQKVLAEVSEDARHFLGSVLLIEDIKTNQKIVSKVLSGLNVDLHIADSYEAAVDMLQQSNFDVVFLNPQLQGLEWRMVVKEAKSQQGTHIPIAVISIPENFDRKPFVTQGITDFITKPFDHNSFLEVTKKYLSF